MIIAPDNSPKTSDWRLDWPTSAGGRVASVLLKATADDFFVDEDLRSADELMAGGEHLCIRLEKKGDNTDYVARQLAILSGCRHFDVGFCGLKDRHAVTRQWFSVYRPGQEDEDAAFVGKVAENWPVLEYHRQARKLRRGDHRGNHFELVLRELSGAPDAVDAALERLREMGCPNYFGRQRFGHNGANLDRALAMDPSKLNHRGSRNAKKRGRGRSSAGSGDSKNVLYFSAARSWLFNEVLAYRVQTGTWFEPLEGEPGASENQHIMVTGPLWGDGGTDAVSVQGEIERTVVGRHPRLAAVFATTRMKPERRPLRMKPEALEWQWQGNDQLRLKFWLAPGQYATSLLGDVFEITDATRLAGED
ncbi:tRNA pseudouridine(13) synthase TruD [Marinobacter orientalis]|uniref:tRNA pseudouridine synthase D n=1 Tax=Marinobacter orientalis TaxID=1928859 RepID=A0A7Y0RFR8_9GAMM|nr:tRNA pseudouridine(13) synthase TruD [Marinobacter orientalis]NMT65398.1 tRNA pseudouridine(13) synthase TruD [Marinobacter orientalis]TGX47629.1 tRNA pseudouridine(13) synthase TruD [Marinobacter orientalis]